jgi:hypothetical protein
VDLECRSAWWILGIGHGAKDQWLMTND